MLSMLLLGAVALSMLSAPRALRGSARLLLAGDRGRWAEQAGLSYTADGLAGSWRGVAVTLADAPPDGVLIRCATEVDIPALEVFVNARLVPLGFTFIRPDAPGVARWALARREHLALLAGWLSDEALFLELASLLRSRRARLRGGWLELELPSRPHDITALLDEVTPLVARLRAAWWQPREALAARWSLRFARVGGGWQLHGRLHGAPLWGAFSVDTGRLTLTLPRAPLALRVSRRGEGPADVIGNPLLDHLLAVRCPPPREFLHDPDLSAALLAVVHGIPGAVLRSGTLTIEGLPDDPDRLDEVIASLVDLSRAWPADRI